MAMIGGQVLDDEVCCDECKSSDLMQTRDGDLACTACGHCQKSKCFDMTIEVRLFEEDDAEGVRVERAGTLGDVNALQGTGMSQVAPGMKMKANVGALNRAAQNTADKAEQKNSQNAQKLKELNDRIGANEATYRYAWDLFIRYSKAVEFKETEEVMLACLYIACREDPVEPTRQFIEISRAATKKISVSQIHDRVNSIKLALNMVFDSSAVRPENYVMRYGSALSLEHKAKQLSFEIATLISENGLLQGKNPKTAASVALWMGSTLTNESRPLSDICEQSGAAVATIKKAWGELYPSRRLVVPPEYLDRALALPEKIS